MSEGQRRSHKKVEAERQLQNVPKVINPVDGSVQRGSVPEPRQPLFSSHQAEPVASVPAGRVDRVVPEQKTATDIEQEHKAKLTANKVAMESASIKVKKDNSVEVLDKDSKALDKLSKTYKTQPTQEEHYSEDSTTESESSLTSDSDYY